MNPTFKRVLLKNAARDTDVDAERFEQESPEIQSLESQLVNSLKRGQVTDYLLYRDRLKIARRQADPYPFSSWARNNRQTYTAEDFLVPEGTAEAHVGVVGGGGGGTTEATVGRISPEEHRVSQLEHSMDVLRYSLITAHNNDWRFSYGTTTA